MNGSLFEGDYVVINKLAYGSRIPMTPLALKFNGSKKYLDWIQVPYMRLPGYSEIKINDVLAFNYELEQEHPTDMQEEFIKRCVALPGDSLEIFNGKVYANSENITTSAAYHYYNVISLKKPDSLSLLKAGIIISKSPQRENTYSFLMSAADADSILKLKYVESVTIELYKKENFSPAIFPNNALYLWNNDHFGPLWIPKQGDSIFLGKKNIIIYQRCIEHFEKEIIESRNDSVFISGKLSTYYTFKQNYYFVLGDNRHNSIDSRVFGPIPQDHIIGKASYILFSKKSESKFSAIK